LKRLDALDDGKRHRFKERNIRYKETKKEESKEYKDYKERRRGL